LGLCSYQCRQGFGGNLAYGWSGDGFLIHDFGARPILYGQKSTTGAEALRFFLALRAAKAPLFDSPSTPYPGENRATLLSQKKSNLARAGKKHLAVDFS
jgi:hypothetical protein